MIKCIVIDDEPIAHQILEKYILEYDGLTLIGHCSNAMEGLAMLNQYAVDLIFLDIQMPLISGLTFLKNLTNPPKIIFTTAYHDFALQGFELNAVDYLLKPFSFKRFEKAVKKAEWILEKEATPERTGNHLIISDSQGMEKIFYDDILYIEAMGDYMKFHTEGKFYLQHITLKMLEEQLPTDRFVRIHKSYIVSLQKIKLLKKDKVIISENISLPLSLNFKSKVLAAFFNNSAEKEIE